MIMNKYLVAAVLVTVASIAAPIAGFVGEVRGQTMTSTGVRVPFLHGFPIGSFASQDELASLARAIEWINSPPLDTTQLRGRVVLVDFWTYSCINWRRTMPYLRNWAEKYRDHGLVVIGVHTPEFSFEKDIDNVRRATREQHIDYPVAIDSDYEIWEAFDNHYWPALYFVDAQGRIRHQQFGEGNYDQLEAVIVELLAEAGHSLPAPELTELAGHGARSRRGLEEPAFAGNLCGLRALWQFRLDHGGPARNVAAP